eukprot:CAMPEP_0202107080 /NCGR_PEP_ID=MMETSP0965-20130614/14805_1 /ASSEMBLY_ACC=CAM_ASM_000507 /TAXON_ID=4773 /ORGANISM="Schizochytrium aggregatum, Strain ATCC28209" /LENGTH=35 /DNA_ID= /DNA_START= /DNA_END= /DNA_ORIENTATION=
MASCSLQSPARPWISSAVATWPVGLCGVLKITALV